MRVESIQRKGLDVAAYKAVLLGQDGACPICHRRFPPETWPGPLMAKGLAVIDHDHTCCPGRHACGRCVRGIVCGSCNDALALFDRVGCSLLYWAGLDKLDFYCRSYGWSRERGLAAAAARRRYRTQAATDTVLAYAGRYRHAREGGLLGAEGGSRCQFRTRPDGTVYPLAATCNPREPAVGYHVNRRGERVAAADYGEDEAF